jgi:hypothetical protein
MRIGPAYYHELKPIGKMNTMKTMMAMAAFALATGTVQATPLSVLLGLPKATADLTPADIDGLTDCQINQLAAAERYPDQTQYSTSENRAFLEKQHAAIQARLRDEGWTHREMNGPTKPAFAVKVVSYTWELGGFNLVSIIHVTLKNLSKVTLGNIMYETHYFAETGKQCDSALGAHEIDKILKPGQTRTFEVNDGYVDAAKVQKMSFVVTDYDVIP